MDIQLIATAVSTVLAPFTPYLIKAGQGLGNKLADLIAEKGGEAVWQQVEAIWGRIQAAFGEDQEVQSAAMLVSANPEDEARQKMFADILVARLKENPTVGNELMKLMGGQQAVQHVIANRKSTIEDVSQESTGDGEQTIKADNESVIRGVKQIKK